MKMGTYNSAHLDGAADRRAQAEIQLRDRALAGDQKAKCELEARQLRIDTDNVTRALHDKAARGDMAAMDSLRRIAAGRAPAAGGAAPAPANASAQIATAAAQAKATERARWTKVFASPHSRGRERGCAAILSSGKWTAEEITRELPHLPTDAEAKAKSGATTSKAAGDRWDKARAKVTKPAEPSAPAAAAEAPDATDRWARAYERATR